MFWRTRKLIYEEERAYVISTIREFLDGTGGAWDWDGFISRPTGYPDLAAVQGFCLGLRRDYPPTEKTSWCNHDGFRELRRKLEELETEDGTRKD